MSEFEDNLRVFFGDLNEQTARVYATLDSTLSECGGDGYQLSGEIRGPYSVAGATLPAVAQMSDLPGDSLLCAAVVTDPCFWITDHPAVYRVTVRLSDAAGKVQREATRQIGFRPLGVRGRSFYFSGRRWVMRAIHLGRSEEMDFARLRASETTVICEDIDLDFFSEASEQGVRILVDLRQHSDPAAALTLAANFPAAIATILNRDAGSSFNCDPKTLARNVMFIADCDSDHLAEHSTANGVDAREMPNWADAVWRSAEQIGTAELDRPTIVWSEGSGDAEARRGSIDRLQAQLAPTGQFAGYAIIN